MPHTITKLTGESKPRQERGYVEKPHKDPLAGRDTDSRVPILIADDVRAQLRGLLFEPEMRGVGYSEFVDRAVQLAKQEIEDGAPGRGPVPYEVDPILQELADDLSGDAGYTPEQVLHFIVEALVKRDAR